LITKYGARMTTINTFTDEVNEAEAVKMVKSYSSEERERGNRSERRLCSILSKVLWPCRLVDRTSEKCPSFIEKTQNS